VVVVVGPRPRPSGVARAAPPRRRLRQWWYLSLGLATPGGAGSCALGHARRALPLERHVPALRGRVGAAAARSRRRARVGWPPAARAAWRWERRLEQLSNDVGAAATLPPQPMVRAPGYHDDVHAGA